MDMKTQALTKDGWRFAHELACGTEVLGLDPDTREAAWHKVDSVCQFDYKEGDLVHWKNSHGFDVISLPEQEWVVAHRDRDGYVQIDAPVRLRTTQMLCGSNRQLVTGGGISKAFLTAPIYENFFVELIGWVVTEGSYQKQRALTGVFVAQSPIANPEKTARIRRVAAYFASQGATAREHVNSANGMSNFYFGVGIGDAIRRAAPDKQLTPKFISSLTLAQAELLYRTLIDADGHRSKLRSHDGYNRTVSTENFIQKDQGRIDSYQMLAAMLAKRTCAKEHSAHPGVYNVVTYARPLTTARHLKDIRIPYAGALWSPRIETQTWLARRNGGTFWARELPARFGTKLMPGRPLGQTVHEALTLF